MNSIDAQIAMIEAYDIAYSIFDHNSRTSQNPFAVIGMHYKEDVSKMNRYNRRMEEYVDNQIWLLFRLSFLDWIDQPVDRVVEQLDFAKRMITKKKIPPM